MSDGRRLQAKAAFGELLDLVQGAEAGFLDGPRAVDGASAPEGYRWLGDLLGLALDCYVRGDRARPCFVPLTRGAGAEPRECFVPLDPSRAWRLRGVRGDAACLSLTLYGGPDDGRFANRIIAACSDHDLAFDAAGRFQIVLSREQPKPTAASWIRLEDDAVCLVVRDYLEEPQRQTRATWSIEALDAPRPTMTADDAELARRFRAARNFIRDTLNVTPPALDVSRNNVIGQPRPAPSVHYGWDEPDVCEASGVYRLAADEALLIEGRSPECAFWNMALCDPFLQPRHPSATTDGARVHYQDDGGWRIVVSAKDPGVRNHVSAAGPASGRIRFRWVRARSLPERPSTRVIRLSELRAGRSGF